MPQRLQIKPSSRLDTVMSLFSDSFRGLCFYLLPSIFNNAERVPEWHCTPSLESDSHLLGINVKNRTTQSVGSSILTADVANLIQLASDQPVPCSSSSAICSLQRAQWEWEEGRQATIVSEWDLICRKEYKAGLADSLFFSGGLLGMATWTQ